jgi:hypothetical protein
VSEATENGLYDVTLNYFGSLENLMVEEQIDVAEVGCELTLPEGTEVFLSETLQLELLNIPSTYEKALNKSYEAKQIRKCIILSKSSKTRLKILSFIKPREKTV